MRHGREEPWHTDPLALDGLLQLALLWTDLRLENASLPTTIGEIRLRPFPGPRTLRGIVQGGEVARHRTRCDGLLVDDQGTVFAELRGIEFHTISSEPSR